MTEPPVWFKLGQGTFGPVLGSTILWLRERESADLTLGGVPHAAAVHLATCLDASIEVNRQGRHAVAIALIRQCVEALSLVECGVVNPTIGAPMVERWLDDRLTLGALRGELEKVVWHRYGNGLWSEPWSEYAGELARAVQPYAHYTPLLMGWQFAVPPDIAPVKNKFIAAIGTNTYDPLKATRVTLLHCLIVWTLARIFEANNRPCALAGTELRALTAALADAEYLTHGKAPWAQELWPHLWFTDGRRRFT